LPVLPVVAAYLVGSITESDQTGDATARTSGWQAAARRSTALAVVWTGRDSSRIGCAEASSRTNSSPRLSSGVHHRDYAVLPYAS
jgi:hypothetical protein